MTRLVSNFRIEMPDVTVADGMVEHARHERSMGLLKLAS